MKGAERKMEERTRKENKKWERKKDERDRIRNKDGAGHCHGMHGGGTIMCTVELVITHTPPWMVESMGYHRSWVTTELV
jgi:hypothetical protein